MHTVISHHHKKKKQHHIIAAVALVIITVSAILSISTSTMTDSRTYAWEPAPQWMWPLSLIMPSHQEPRRTLKLSSFAVPTPLPTPTGVLPTSRPGQPTYTPAPVLPPGEVPVTTPIIGGPIPPANFYCIDDVDPDMCDDSSSYLVPKGVGGATGSCGSIISMAHQLVEALPQVMKGTRDSLSHAVSSSCGSAGPESNYVSTKFVIDAFNLAGFTELSKSNPAHISPTGLFNWWQVPPSGYIYLPYTPTLIQDFATGKKDLTGCVMFLNTGSSYHIGIVNKLELFTQMGDGVISILQSGTSMYIDRFPISGWSVENASTNQTVTNGLTGFGCHM